MNWYLRIEKAENGYICSWYDEPNENEYKENKVLFEQLDEMSELDCMVKLLYFVKEHFGVYYSKHNRHNIDIGIVERGAA